jgi:hypothetical protein
MTVCWPGLPRLWWRGQSSGFVTAALFGLWFNATLAATYVVPHLAPFGPRLASWALLTVVWVICVRRGAARLSQFYGGERQRDDELFSRAQEEYLRGQWFEAESLLLRLLRNDPADVEGRLLLATLYRHTKRPDLARAQYRHLEQTRDAGRWQWEIFQERVRLDRLENESPVAEAINVVDSPVGPDATATEIRGDLTGPADREDNSQSSMAAAPQCGGNEDSALGDGLSKAA